MTYAAYLCVMMTSSPTTLLLSLVGRLYSSADSQRRHRSKSNTFTLVRKVLIVDSFPYQALEKVLLEAMRSYNSARYTELESYVAGMTNDDVISEIGFVTCFVVQQRVAIVFARKITCEETEREKERVEKFSLPLLKKAFVVVWK